MAAPAHTRCFWSLLYIGIPVSGQLKLSKSPQPCKSLEFVIWKHLIYNNGQTKNYICFCKQTKTKRIVIYTQQVWNKKLNLLTKHQLFQVHLSPLSIFCLFPIAEEWKWNVEWGGEGAGYITRIYCTVRSRIRSTQNPRSIRSERAFFFRVLFAYNSTHIEREREFATSTFMGPLRRIM